MKILGQNFRCGFYGVPPEQRLNAIKRAGFDAVMLWWGGEYEKTDGTRYELIEGAFKKGLQVNTVHFPSTNAHWLWVKERSGDYVTSLIKAIQDCSRYGVENIVMHTTRRLITPPYNEMGIEELSRAVKAAEREGVNIAVENTRFPDYNLYIYESIKSERLKLCYDTGHEHCYTKDWDILKNFGDRLVTTHIHDNNGFADEHHLPGEGDIDFAPIFKRLNALGVKYYNLESYCNETSAYYGKIDLEGFLKLAHEKLVELIENSDCGN